MHGRTAGILALAGLLLMVAFAPLNTFAQVQEHRRGTVSITLVEDNNEKPGSGGSGGGGGGTSPTPDRVTAPPGGNGDDIVTIIPKENHPELGDLPKTGGDTALAVGLFLLGGLLLASSAALGRK